MTMIEPRATDSRGTISTGAATVQVTTSSWPMKPVGRRACAPMFSAALLRHRSFARRSKTSAWHGSPSLHQQARFLPRNSPSNSLGCCPILARHAWCSAYPRHASGKCSLVDGFQIPLTASSKSATQVFASRHFDT
ncbi:hypothetical protein Bpfe_031081 [Biomphalaria pfeifferi]|uniref:Uncharacterized protein n=1 Tax=Biomphalaria pfeifferi TaxID=112525 RepID=A0AAD8ANI5_BIOPF|nr:hypothetical protein Bpfe_031081 [Biomphalaria pfeifferi]